jgi:hypothetical protein
MNIAAVGYQGVGPGDTVFFPLYPYLVGILSKITLVNVTLAGICVSSIAACFALILFYDLVQCLSNDEKLAKTSVLLFALYPTAFFLHAPFTDALFLLCSIASIWMMVRKKAISAGVFACAAGLTRPQGLLLLLPMLVFYFQAHQTDKKYLNWREISAFGIAPFGFGAYSIWRATSGLSGIFQSLQEYSNVQFQDPITTLGKAFVRIFTKPTFSEITELLSVLFFLAILIWMFTQPRFRQHVGILLYSSATWILIASKTTIAGAPFQSSNRYVLHIFFAFVGMAALLEKTPEKIRKAAIPISLTFGLIFSALYALWFFVG